MSAIVARKVRAARLSILSNALLVLFKLGVGVVTGSVAVLSEAAHSATDLIASLIAFIAVRSADAPPDARHPYGHGKMESLSGAVEALLILAAGVYIVFQAGQALLRPREHLGTESGMAIMAISAVVNLFLARYLFRVARETDSAALEADAHHLSIDVLTSVGVVAGLALVRFTGISLFDPLVALIVAGFILHTGGSILRDAFAPLLDERLPQEEIRIIERIMTANPNVLGWHKLRTRKAGSHRHVDVHIQMDDDMSLREAHRRTEELEDEMRAALTNLHVVIHTEPYEEERTHQEQFHSSPSPPSEP
ncbi:MAG: cation diffusion facilitator family transporter [Capsulimonadales bacterium]|nr:cation diffusion facilitator family transporter [Capsulimonadales bacterium]